MDLSMSKKRLDTHRKSLNMGRREYILVLKVEQLMKKIRD